MLLLLCFLLQLCTASLRRSAAASSLMSSPPPLKVFLMVGQSNMQGHGYQAVHDDDGNFLNGTLEWMVNEFPDLYGKLKQKDGNWTARQDTWITYNRQGIGNVRMEVNQHGELLPGYGGDPGQSDQLGPELGFGWTLAEAINGQQEQEQQQQQQQPQFPLQPKQQQQLLLLKIAWGGRNLSVDFRPPSSGGITGLYYESVMANTVRTLERLPELFPNYAITCGGRYELAGFVWHQGWNDGCDKNMANEYEVNLANLIRDVRKDLGVPNLPVSIGVSGFGGYKEKAGDTRDQIVQAQFAMANATKYPEFAGTVAAAETRDFARPPRPASPGNQVYHWNNNCETYWLIGKAMAEGMFKLLNLTSERTQPLAIVTER